MNIDYLIFLTLLIFTLKYFSIQMYRDVSIKLLPHKEYISFIFSCLIIIYFSALTIINFKIFGLITVIITLRLTRLLSYKIYDKWKDWKINDQVKLDEYNFALCTIITSSKIFFNFSLTIIINILLQLGFQGPLLIILCYTFSFIISCCFFFITYKLIQE